MISNDFKYYFIVFAPYLRPRKKVIIIFANKVNQNEINHLQIWQVNISDPPTTQN